ncbi:ubiquitin domain-containing protein 1-like isoform X1 [Lates japonicus]|uniref:Ubiquitin domain-containing protein 1-like isoform X1 n=1 Tax=Lates japonicus TaxID=270547 RepID=A0AAD3MSI5_LATJO|nr:ubiquitin domain-containing protein 1-like isoform X1 [Lates japonicus]
MHNLADWISGTVMGGCVGRSRTDGQGSARSSTRSKKRGVRQPVKVLAMHLVKMRTAVSLSPHVLSLLSSAISRRRSKLLTADRRGSRRKSGSDCKLCQLLPLLILLLPSAP